MIKREHYEEIRDQCASLTKDEVDLVLLGQIMASIHLGNVVGPSSKHSPSPRERSRVDFYHHGRKLCQSTFLMLHGVGKVL